MNFRYIKATFIASFAMMSLMGFSQSNVLQIMKNQTYMPREWKNIMSVDFDSVGNKFVINSIEDSSVTMPIEDLMSIPSGPTIPAIYITTDRYLTEIPSKTVDESAVLYMKGFGRHADFEETKVAIRGRGNSSWAQWKKKPYRLKFDKKQELCGLNKAKSYVLLANAVDPSLMQNAVTSKIAEMLDMPYNNVYVPVDVFLNDIYKGSYMLTNKPGINAGSVDIDEDNSIMWELDTNYDEDYKFHSPIYGLPVQVSDPDVDDATFQYWKSDFNAMESAVSRQDCADYIDLDLFARFILVNDIVKNDELGHPKSLKLYKTKGDKYKFGPLWDFDGAMGFWGAGGQDFYTQKLITERVSRTRFLQDIEKMPQARAAYKAYWKEIRERLDEIMDFIDEYAAMFRTSGYRDVELYKGSQTGIYPYSAYDIDESVEQMKQWLRWRFAAIDNFDIVKN